MLQKNFGSYLWSLLLGVDSVFVSTNLYIGRGVCISMSVEDEIRNKLMQGYSPQQVIQQGYKKSTVYKIYSSTKSQSFQITQPSWSIQNATALDVRYLPGQSVPLGFLFRNDSLLDIYVNKIGLRAEWMQPDSWHAQEINDLVKRGTQRWFSFSLPIPRDVKLGEYELLFGLEGQYLPTTQFQPTQVEWSEPAILHVKQPLTGMKIFFSHSTEDITLVRQLEASLDNAGISVTIGEDVISPGIVLSEKFERLIRESNLVLGFLTESGARSEWVLKEVNYALQIGKPHILLKEESVQIDTNREWVKFSRNASPDEIFLIIMNSITMVQKNMAAQANPIGAIIGAGILVFLLGAIASGSKS